MIESAGDVDAIHYPFSLSNLAKLHLVAGRLKEAYQLTRQAGEVMERTGRAGSMGRLILLQNEAVLLLRLGEIKRAEVALRSAIQREQGDDLSKPAVEPALATHYGEALLILGRPEEATRWLKYATQKARESHDTYWETQAKILLTRAQIDLGLLGDAQLNIAEAEAEWPQDKVANRKILQDVSRVMAQLQLALHQPVEAKQRMNVLLGELGYPQKTNSPGLIGALPLAAEIDLALNDPAAAETLAAAALAVAENAARDPGQSADVGKALLILGQARLSRGNTRGASEALTRAITSLTQGLGQEHAMTREARSWLAKADGSPTPMVRAHR